MAARPPVSTADVRRAANVLMPSAGWRAVARAAYTIVAWYVRRQQAQRAIAELSSLSDHMLKDIGIQRCDIERIARFGRDDTDLRA
jgi:uncharacterized protein YjiS (DUF1127 family)